MNSKRDWGHAKDYVEVMWLILQQDIAEDWVISTGKTTSIRDFVRMCFEFVGIEIEFKGKGLNEFATVVSCSNKNYIIKKNQEILSVDKRYFRPTEVDILIGDSSKAREKLGWVPKISLDELVKDMMASDLEYYKKEKYLIEGGHKTFNYFE